MRFAPAAAVLIVCIAGVFAAPAAAQTEGPPPSARIPPETVKAEMQAAGHAQAAEYAFLPHQYFLVFRPAS